MLFRLLAGMALATALVVPGHAQDWKPDRPITIIVPWAAGGSTDQVTRVTAAVFEEALGQKVVVVNQPGASGSIGTKNALNAPKDGYTWTAGAAQDLGTYKVLGMLDTGLEDWHLFLSVANVAVVGVNPSTPYKTMDDLLAAMKEKPDSVTVATAGINSSGHTAIEAIAKAADVTYRHVTYDGGNPAVVATVAGETEATTQLAVEQAEMIRGERIRPLAALTDKPLELEGFGTIPPITESIASLQPPTNYFGLFIPKGIPENVLATIEKVWTEKVMNAKNLQTYATNRGALFAPVHGEEAHKLAFPAVQTNAWLLFESGKAKISPDTVGIPKP